MALLDVNALVALAWDSHVHHAAVRAWFSTNSRDGWSTCPVTESGFVRVSSNPKVLPSPIGVAAARGVLSALLSRRRSPVRRQRCLALRSRRPADRRSPASDRRAAPDPRAAPRDSTGDLRLGRRGPRRGRRRGAARGVKAGAHRSSAGGEPREQLVEARVRLVHAALHARREHAVALLGGVEERRRDDLRAVAEVLERRRSRPRRGPACPPTRRSARCARAGVTSR